MAEPQLPKLMAWVRFPSPAPSSLPLLAPLGIVARALLLLALLSACAPLRNQLASAITAATGTPWQIHRGPWLTLTPPGILWGEVEIAWRPNVRLRAERLLLPLTSWVQVDRHAPRRLELSTITVPAFVFNGGTVSFTAPHAVLSWSPTPPALQHLMIRDGAGEWSAAAQSRWRVHALQLTFGPRAADGTAALQAAFMADNSVRQFPVSLTGQFLPAADATTGRVAPLHLTVVPAPADDRPQEPWTLTTALHWTQSQPATVTAVAEPLQLSAAPVDLNGRLTLTVSSAAPVTATLMADRLRLGAVTGSQVQLTARADPHEMTADFVVGAFYHGQVYGRLRRGTADAAPARLELTVQANALALAPLLHALHGQPLVSSGQAALRLALHASGDDPTAIAHTLAGEVGVEAQAVVLDHTLVAAALTGLPPEWRARLPVMHLTTLAATAQGNAGVFHSDDLHAHGPAFTLNGRGRFTVPSGALAVDLVTVLQRTAGIAELADLPIPVRVRGDWRQPRWSLDWHAVLRAAAQRARERR